MGQSKYDYWKEGILLCSTTSWGASRFLRRVAGGLPSFDSMIEKKQKTLLDVNDEKNLVSVRFRSIDDKSYKVTEIINDEDEAIERQFETDMT